MADPIISPVELRIARLVSEGWYDREIARELGVTYDVARQRLRILSRKLGVTNRAMVAAWYVKREAR